MPDPSNDEIENVKNLISKMPILTCSSSRGPRKFCVTLSSMEVLQTRFKLDKTDYKGWDQQTFL